MDIFTLWVLGGETAPWVRPLRGLGGPAEFVGKQAPLRIPPCPPPVSLRQTGPRGLDRLKALPTPFFWDGPRSGVLVSGATDALGQRFRGHQASSSRPSTPSS